MEQFTDIQTFVALTGIPRDRLELGVSRIFGDRSLRIDSNDDLDQVVNFIIEHNMDEFCWSLQFSPQFLANLFYAAFLPICTSLGDIRGVPLYCLLPKLHFSRSVLVPPGQVSVSTSTKKKCKKYVISVDTDFESVLAGCYAQHAPNCWLLPPLVRCLRELHRTPLSAVMDENSTIHVHSIELRKNDESSTVVAGELGYTVGSVYTSLTGFYTETGSGSVQLALLGELLQKRGFKVWDLGMGMSYKTGIGAIDMDRRNFVKLIRRFRNDVVTLTQ